MVDLVAHASAVAEAWVAPEHKRLYASAEGLGQTFSFDLLVCEWEADKLRTTINDAIEDTKTTESSTTWVFSNHDVSRPTGDGMVPH